MVSCHVTVSWYYVMVLCYGDRLGVVAGHVAQGIAEGKGRTMRAIVFVLGLLMVLAGVVWILWPDMLKRVMGFWATGYLTIAGALLKLAAGVFFLVAATQCDRTAWIVALGILACLQGVVFLAMSQARRKALLGWFQSRSGVTIRLLGLVVLAFGVLVAWAAGVPR